MWHPSLHILKVPARYFKWVSHALKVSRCLKIGPLNHPIDAVFPTKWVELGRDVDILKCHIIFVSIYQISYSFRGRGSPLSSDTEWWWCGCEQPITEIISRHSYVEKWWCIMSAHSLHTVYLYILFLQVSPISLKTFKSGNAAEIAPAEWCLSQVSISEHYPQGCSWNIVCVCVWYFLPLGIRFISFLFITITHPSIVSWIPGCGTLYSITLHSSDCSRNSPLALRT